MNTKIMRLLVVLALTLGMALPMLAQRQTGSIVGTVSDKDGGALPGVGVSARSPALILPEVTALTNEQGIYRFPALPPGSYAITYAMDGMNTLIREGIILSIGQTITLDVSLELKTLEKTVVVTGEAPQVDLKKTGHATVLDAEFLKTIPTGRDLGSYLSMAPGMMREEGEQFWLKGTAGVGSNVRENKFNLDGINLNDAAAGVQQVEFAMDIMEQVSVDTGGIAAEYGGASGSVINVISKSGGNKLSGSAAFYFRDKSLQATNTNGTPLEGNFSGFKTAYEPSLTLGGPVIKDKLWFFLGGSYVNTSKYISGFPYDLDRNVPTVQSSPYAFGKLSFQPDQKNKFSLSYNFSREFNSDFFATSFDTERTTIVMTTPIHSVSALWTRFFSDNFFSDLRVNYVDWNMFYVPQPGQTGPLFTDLITGLNSGSAAADYHWSQGRFGAKIDGTLFVDALGGNHQFKAGVEYNSVHLRANYKINDRVTEPVQGFSTIMTLGETPYIGVRYLDTDSRDIQQDVSFYLQDSWAIGKRLTLNLGARLGTQWMTVPKQNENEDPQTIGGLTFNRSVPAGFTSLTWTSIDPRVGLNFDITGDGKTLFKASYGRYSQALRAYLSTRFNPNGVAGAVYLIEPDLTPIFPINVFYTTVAKTTYGDQGADVPYTDEFTVAVEREIANNWSGGLRYVKKLGRNNVWDVNGAQLDINRLVNNGELSWTNWEQVPFVDPTDGENKFFWSQEAVLAPDMYLLNVPGANRDFAGLELTLTKRYAQGWFMMASYMWGKLTGLLDTGYMQSDPYGAKFFQDPNAHVNATGRLEMDRRHQVKLQGLVQGPWGINVSAFARFLSGTRYTRMLSAAQLGIPLAQGDATIYAEARGSRAYPARLTVDLRLEKEFRIKTTSFGVFADAFNLLNSNKALEAYALSNNPDLAFGTMLRIENPRIIRLGARFSF